MQCALAARRAIEMSQRLGYKAPLVDAMGTYAKCLVLGGQLKEGFALFAQAWEAALAANHVRTCRSVGRRLVHPNVGRSAQCPRMV